MKTKLICSDIDGTLLNKDRELSTKTITAVKERSFIPFILISSRMPQAMKHLQAELNISHLPLICYNGGLILKGERVLHSTEIGIKITDSLVGGGILVVLLSSITNERLAVFQWSIVLGASLVASVIRTATAGVREEMPERHSLRGPGGGPA